MLGRTSLLNRKALSHIEKNICVHIKESQREGKHVERKRKKNKERNYDNFFPV